MSPLRSSLRGMPAAAALGLCLALVAPAPHALAQEAESEIAPSLRGWRDGKGRAAGGTVPSARELEAAATSPLSDLNLVRDEIPPLLVAARRAPYAVPGNGSCLALGSAVTALDEVLGDDLDDHHADKAKPDLFVTLIERSADAIGDAAVDTVKGAVTGLIPYRGWLRRLTGAHQHARDLSAAVMAGSVRRAWLRGVMEGKGCAQPGGPVGQGGPAGSAG